MAEVKLPELGENIEIAEVVNVYIKKGDTVKEEDPLIELETDKAALDMPSPESGTISEVLVSVGDKIKVGQVVVKIADGDVPAKAEKEPEQKEIKKTKEEEKKEEVVVQDHSEVVEDTPEQEVDITDEKVKKKNLKILRLLQLLHPLEN